MRKMDRYRPEKSYLRGMVDALEATAEQQSVQPMIEKALKEMDAVVNEWQEVAQKCWR